MQAWLQGMGFGGGVGGMGHMMGRYEHSFAAYGAVFIPNATQEKTTEIDHGGKILLPSSALDMLLRMNIQYPMLFKVMNPNKQRVTNAGVLEFSASEGQAILPHWMMTQLGLNDGDQVKIDSATLPKATFVKLKPMSLEFLNITNPKAVLEVELRKYACLTKGDKIATSYAEQTLEFLVIDLKPANSVCIIECDVNLDFDAPEGYVEQPKQASTAVNIKPPAPPASAFAGAGQSLGSSAGNQSSTSSMVFAGTGRRLDGKKKASSSISMSSEIGGGKASTSDMTGIASDLPALPPVVVNEDYKPGRISFVRYDYKRLDVLEKELREKKAAEELKPSNVFKGGNKTLRSCR